MCINNAGLHVKKVLKKFLNSIKLFLLFSNEMSRSRDVLIPSTPGMQFKISILKIHDTEKIINYTTGFLSLCN